MYKLLFLAALFSISCFGSVHAFPNGHNTRQSAGDLYYSGQISHQEYVERLTGFRKPVFINNNNGTSAIIHQATNGNGWINHSDGSRTTFTQY